MIDNDLIQALLIASLKSNATIVDKLPGGAAEEVRESEWQGTNLTYPNVRVELLRQTPNNDIEPCVWSLVTFVIKCFSQDTSSKEADRIAGAANTLFHKKSFVDTANGFKLLRVKSNGLISARRTSSDLWQADASFITELHTI